MNVNDGKINCPAYQDDEVTAMMKACPFPCKCLGHMLPFA